MNRPAFLFIICVFSCRSAIITAQERFETVKTFTTKQAHQGVAVDDECFYTINTKGIGKYDKKSGALIAEINDTTGAIIHFDGAVVVEDKIYCAHSNFPAVPMTGSIEVYDKSTLKHIDTHSFGAKYGSCTWADYYNGWWWVCFGHYDRFRPETGTDARWTTLVRFDRNWNESASWLFPDTVIAEMKPMTCSGGSWGPDGNLYVTGHDSAKVYVLQLPETGSALIHLTTLKAEIKGQGIAWDRTEQRCLYGIIRKKNSVTKLSPLN